MDVSTRFTIFATNNKRISIFSPKIMKINRELAIQLKEKYNAEGTTLRLAQIRMLEMLEYVDTICNSHDLTYWLDSGTLLGAIRHGGFIPWDDDVDICMPYNDAERFKQIMLKENSNKFILQCKETDKGFFGPWYILRDINSEYIINSKKHNHQLYRGLQVDIFIAEDRTNDTIWYFSRFVQKCIDKPLNKITNLRIAAILSSPLFLFMHNILIPFSRIISKKNNYFKMPYGSIWNFKLRKKHIFPIIRHNFEGKELCVPNDYDAYLTTEFGDWQEIPENIWTHNAKISLH